MREFPLFLTSLHAVLGWWAFLHLEPFRYGPIHSKFRCVFVQFSSLVLKHITINCFIVAIVLRWCVGVSSLYVSVFVRLLLFFENALALS